MKFIFNIFGPSTAGKSTTTELLQKHIAHIRVVDFDTIKRSKIPDYHWKVHGQHARSLTLEELSETAQLEQPIVLLYPPAKNREEYQQIADIADANNYKLIDIEITAPRDVLIELYKHRLANIDPAKKGWKFKTLDEFKVKLTEPYFKPKTSVTFDTSYMQPGEIVDAIVQLTE